MNIEIEAKFLNIDRDDLRQRLSKAGYTCTTPDYLMKRVVFNTPNSDGQSWARVRDEAGTVTISYKRTHDISRVDGTEEIQITADDFDTACRLMEALGLKRKSYQETRREIWHRGTAEVTLDEWPALPPFTEMEAPDEATLKTNAAELGFEWDKALFGAVGAVYETVGISHQAINKAPRLTFENVEEILSLKGS